MNSSEATFWHIIDSCRAKAKYDDEQFIELLLEELAKLEADDIIRFRHIFWELFLTSYRNDLWGAAYIMNGGCSDDAFENFRGWLISQGKGVFNAALENPDSLVSIAANYPEDYLYELEEMLYSGVDTWCTKTGLDAEDFLETLATTLERYPVLDEPEWGDGEGGMDEVEGERLYPKLCQKSNLYVKE